MRAWFFLFLILLLGFLLRSQMFLNGDFIYLTDQARDLLLTKGIVVDHKLTLIGGRTGFGGLFHGALWIYMIAPFFAIFKGNPFWSLIPLFEIVNLGIIASGFLAGWKLYGKGIGLLFAFFLAVSSTLISQVPVTTNAEMLPVVFIFYLFSIIKFMRGGEKWIIASLFFLGLGFQFESAFAVLLVPITLLAFLISRKLPTLKNFALAVVAFSFSVGSFILFDLRHNFLMTSAALRLFTNTKEPLPGYEEYSNISFRMLDRISNFWNSMFTPLYSREAIVSVLLLFFITLGILILIKRIYSRQISQFEKEFLFLVLSPIIIFGIYIIYPFPLWPHYLLPIVPLWVFILGLSLKLLWQKPILKPLIAIFIFLSLSIPSVRLLSSYTHNSYIPTSDSSYLNQLEVAKWVARDSVGKNSSYFVYTPGILTYSMDYLFWWLGTSERLVNAKTENSYLIFYPGLSGDKGAHAFWKKNVIHTAASPVLSKEFYGGIIVEKINLSNDKEVVDPNYFQNLIFR